MSYLDLKLHNSDNAAYAAKFLAINSINEIA
jgi:hypothetical protein